MRKMVTLPEEWQKILEALPETGNGYHVVDITLNNNDLLTNRIIFGCKDLQVGTNEQFDVLKIKSIRPIKLKVVKTENHEKGDT